MLFSKILLAITGIAFVGYGLLCIVAPELPAQYIGYQLGLGGSTVEIIAMYGGLQFGLGILYLVTALKSTWQLPGLWLLFATVGSLATSRLLGLIIYGSDDYNMAALFYELSTTGLCIVALALEQMQASTARRPILEPE